jgi:CheY-like chemotaxis protein
MKQILVVDDNKSFDIFTAKLTYARTCEEGLDLLKRGGWDELHIDHDMGMRKIGVSPGGMDLYSNDTEAMSGYQMLLQAHMEGVQLPPIVRIISNNPEGAVRLAACLENDFGYKRSGFTGRMFVRN